MSENWVKENSFCPCCGNEILSEFENNKPVADFFCKKCNEEYEVKSNDGVKLGDKIVDGAYSTMINRITSYNNPNFFFLNYSKSTFSINNFLIIPKHFFVSNIIEKRKPLSENAKRAGWVGCNIRINEIPERGKIFLIKNSKIIDKNSVIENWKSTDFLKSKKLDARGWILDIMNCVDKIESNYFSLADMYKFENELTIKYPENNHIKDKIRQQLQFLRDKGLIEFSNRGTYKKIK